MSIDTRELHKYDEQHHFKLYKRFPVTLSMARGSRVWDTDGNEYIDSFAGIAVNSVGHCHPRVVAAVRAQAETLMHVSNFFLSEPQVQLERKLVELTGLDRVFFTNSGVEAMEAAIKFARKHAHANGREGKILSMEGGFHGRTLGMIAMGKDQHQQGFGPMPGGFERIPFNDIEAVKKHMDETIAVVVEPIQGEGGIRPADKQYLKELRALCDESGALLVLDEIQSGVARTGSMFAYEQYEVRPDILTLAKALGGGVPIGAILATEQVASSLSYGDHGTTFGGNPLATRAAVATLDVIEEENLIDRARELGEMFFKQAEELARRQEAVTDVRGAGLMIGVELAFDAAGVVRRMLDKGVLANAASGNVLRIVPPLTIDPDDLQAVFNALEEAVEEEKQEQG